MATRRYPWNNWFSRPQTILRAGVDYDISQSMMHQTIRNSASKMGLSGKVKIRDLGDSMVIEVPGAKHEVSCTNQATVANEHEDKLAGNAEIEDQTEEGNQVGHGKDNTNNPSPKFASGCDHYSLRATPIRRR